MFIHVPFKRKQISPAPSLDSPNSVKMKTKNIDSFKSAATTSPRDDSKHCHSGAQITEYCMITIILVALHVTKICRQL